MEFIISASTDIGTKKRVNQDALFVKKLRTANGNMALAVLCDGMGGLSYGEDASATVITAFDKWAHQYLPDLSRREFSDAELKEQWFSILNYQNGIIRNHGMRYGIKLGTTITALLLTDKRCYTVNVGDSRAYEITLGVKQITRDHSLVAQEVERGNMTAEQAESSSKRNILTQCIGGSDPCISPDMFFSDTMQNAVYMLCSDGFRHEVTADEILKYFNPSEIGNSDDLKNRELSLIELNKCRGETDNISVITIRTTSHN